MARITLPRNRAILLALAAGGVVFFAAVGLLLCGVDLRLLATRGFALVNHLVVLLRGAGPLAFFAAMALLPAVGVPMFVFTLSAGATFTAQMGMGGMVAAGLAAVTANLLLTYWLARRALRPWLGRILSRLGYKIPQVEAGDMMDLIVLVRVTPGLPFFAQNYLLGLVDAPIGKYLCVSCATSWTYTSVGLIFGDALLGGRGRVVFYAVGILAGLSAGTHLVRRHYSTRKKPA